MKYLKKILCKSCIRSFIGTCWEGFLTAIHIDTRGVEFISGLIAIITGIFLSLPPNITGIQGPSEFWGWSYIFFGLAASIASIFGKWAPRKYIALIGVFLWLNLIIWIITIGHGIDGDDDVVIACIPYSFFVLNSIWTYFGLWRYTNDWRYYHDPDRDT
jgi:hypothetical protein